MGGDKRGGVGAWARAWAWAKSCTWAGAWAKSCTWAGAWAGAPQREHGSQGDQHAETEVGNVAGSGDDDRTGSSWTGAAIVVDGDPLHFSSHRNRLDIGLEFI